MLTTEHQNRCPHPPEEVRWIVDELGPMRNLESDPSGATAAARVLKSHHECTLCGATIPKEPHV